MITPPFMNGVVVLDHHVELPLGHRIQEAWWMISLCKWSFEVKHPFKEYSSPITRYVPLSMALCAPVGLIYILNVELTPGSIGKMYFRLVGC